MSTTEEQHGDSEPPLGRARPRKKRPRTRRFGSSAPIERPRRRFSRCWKGYIDLLKGELDNDALPYRKLAKLFELGVTPASIEGHHHGVTIGLRTGDLHGVATEHDNLLGAIWGSLIGGVTPWAGKTFVPMDASDRRAVQESSLPDTVPVFRGINHFHIIDRAPTNVALNAVLSFAWHLTDAPEAEQPMATKRTGALRCPSRLLGEFADSSRSIPAQLSLCTTNKQVFLLPERFRAAIFVKDLVFTSQLSTLDPRLSTLNRGSAPRWSARALRLWGTSPRSPSSSTSWCSSPRASTSGRCSSPPTIC